MEQDGFQGKFVFALKTWSTAISESLGMTATHIAQRLGHVMAFNIDYPPDIG